MTRFNQLKIMLRKHEGVRSHVYKCSAGYQTIGVGRNISESGIGLTDGEIDQMLMNDIFRVIGELSDEYEWFNNLDDVRRDAMIDISFNLGQTVLRKFTNALKAMEQKDYHLAADEFMKSRWASQVGKRAEELTKMIRFGKYQ